MLFWRGVPLPESRSGYVHQPRDEPRTLHEGYQQSYPPTMRKMLSPFFTARTIAMVTLEVLDKIYILLTQVPENAPSLKYRRTEFFFAKIGLDHFFVGHFFTVCFISILFFFANLKLFLLLIIRNFCDCDSIFLFVS